MFTAFFSELFFKRIPTVLSILLHPLLMPTLGVWIILNSGTSLSLLPLNTKYYILAIVFAFTFGLPIIFLPFYYYSQLITTVKMEKINERFIPFLVTSILYFFAYLVFYRWGMPSIIQTFLLASSFSILLSLIITLKWKISVHTVGIGGIIGLIFCITFMYQVDMLVYFMIIILLSGIVSFSRLSLNAHTPAEVYVGLFVGFLVVTVLILYI